MILPADYVSHAVISARLQVCIFLRSSFPMANFAAKYYIMTQEMVDSFCDSFYIPAEVHPTALGHDKTITQFPVGKVAGVVVLLAGRMRSMLRPPPPEGGQEDVTEEDAYLELADSDEGTVMVRQSEEEVVTEQSKKVKKRRLQKQSDVLPVKKLRTDHPAFASGGGGKTLAGLERIESEGFLDSSARTNLQICTTMESSSALAILVDTTAAATTSTGADATTKLATDVNPDLAGPYHPGESEGSDDSFYSPTTLDPSEAKRWYVPRWSITNDSLLDDDFACCTLVVHVALPAFFFALRNMDYNQLYTKFNVGAARQVYLGAEVRSRAKHELELKEKLRVKYDARGRLQEEKDLEILKLKSKLAEKEVEAAEVIRLRDQVSSLSEEKSSLTAEVSVLKIIVIQKDHDISLLNSRATSLASTLDDAKVTCAEAGHKITSLVSERDRLAFEVSSLRVSFQDFKEKIKVQQEQRWWLLTHGIQLALLKCLKSLEYQGTLGHALGRAVDFGIQEGLEAGHEHGISERSISVVDAYNPEAAKARYVNAVKDLGDVDFSLVSLLKYKKDAGMDKVLDNFLLDGPLAGLPEAAYLQPCIEQLFIPIHHAGDTTAIEETSLSFTLMNVHARADGAKKHAAAIRQLMMDIVSAPLSSQTWVGEASTSVSPLSIEDYDEEDTDEALGSVVVIPKFETCRF
ncbi:hypothetical protein Tco_0481471 [Tanacetum coccineum]